MIRVLLIGALVALLPACERDDKKNQKPAPNREEYAALLDQPSQRPLIQRRRARVINRTIAKALDLDRIGQCRELGYIPCAGTNEAVNIHEVSLGGLDAYQKSQYQYDLVDDITITAPNSLDRFVLSACSQRAGMDFVNPHSAVIYKDIEKTIDGRLKLTPAIDESIHRLYRRAYTRSATASEIESLKELYKEIYALEPFGASNTWMVLACYAVLSSVEGVFY